MSRGNTTYKQSQHLNWKMLYTCNMVSLELRASRAHPRSVAPTVTPVEQEGKALRRFINSSARCIADNIRNYGEKKFDPMWAQGYFTLSDGRIALLQHSLGVVENGVGTGEVLEINIMPTTKDARATHLRYEFKPGEIRSFESRENGKLLIRYEMNDRPNKKISAPVNPPLHDVFCQVIELLRPLKIDSKNITLTNPASIPVPTLDSSKTFATVR